MSVLVLLDIQPIRFVDFDISNHHEKFLYLLSVAY